MGVPLYVEQVNVSMGNRIPENCPKHGQKHFYFFSSFFFLFLLERVVLGTGSLAKFSLVLWALY